MLLNGPMGRLEITVTRTHLIACSASIDVRVPTGLVEELGSAIADLRGRVPHRSHSQVHVVADQLGVIALDAGFAPLAQVLWSDDQCSADDAVWCNKKFPAQWWIERIGEVPRTGHGLTKLSWLHRTDPKVWSEMSHLCGVDDLVRWLMDEREPKSSMGVVSTSAFLTEMGIVHPDSGRIDSEVLSLIDRTRDWAGVFPAMQSAGTVVGSWNGADIVV